MKLLLLPQDKANHFLYGFMIYFVCTFFIFSKNTTINEFIYLGIVTLFAVGKEVYSYVTVKTKFDILDIIATVIAPLLFCIKQLLKL